MTPARSALIVANGDLPSDKALRSALAAADFVLAADGGANGLLARGIIPDAVLGDFDSLAAPLPASVRRVSAPDQDYTDLDKAVQFVRSEGFDSAVIVGATGDRLDHTFGALSVLIKHGRSLPIQLVDAIGASQLIAGGLTLATFPQQTVSLLALGRVEGIVTTGLKWELDHETLASGVRDGISNLALGKSVTVQVASGDLIVYLHHLPSPSPDSGR